MYICLHYLLQFLYNLTGGAYSIIHTAQNPVWSKSVLNCKKKFILNQGHGGVVVSTSKFEGFGPLFGMFVHGACMFFTCLLSD